MMIADITPRLAASFLAVRDRRIARFREAKARLAEADRKVLEARRERRIRRRILRRAKRELI